MISRPCDKKQACDSETLKISVFRSRVVFLRDFLVTGCHTVTPSYVRNLDSRVTQVYVERICCDFLASHSKLKRLKESRSAT
jgi:hypothetical protein